MFFFPILYILACAERSSFYKRKREKVMYIEKKKLVMVSGLA